MEERDETYNGREEQLDEKILQACKRLQDYSYFMKEVNGGIDRGMEPAEAIATAMEYCIENDVLADILLKSKSEVFHMLLTEYDEKKHLKHVKEEGREEAQEQLFREFGLVQDEEK